MSPLIDYTLRTPDSLEAKLNSYGTLKKMIFCIQSHHRANRRKLGNWPANPGFWTKHGVSGKWTMAHHTEKDACSTGGGRSHYYLVVRGIVREPVRAEVRSLIRTRKVTAPSTSVIFLE